jgi:hypothetical protein
MIHIAKEHEELWIFSMGKRFRVRAIADTDAEANQYMERHSETALIACFGSFNIIANQYEGIEVFEAKKTNATLAIEKTLKAKP